MGHGVANKQSVPNAWVAASFYGNTLKTGGMQGWWRAVRQQDAQGNHIESCELQGGTLDDGERGQAVNQQPVGGGFCVFLQFGQGDSLAGLLVGGLQVWPQAAQAFGL
ncbi:hypothetical protein LHU53_13180 [Rhodoferax sp. U2-2l]|uniref:hypothetical protein n=1 Tax=Rhodoferax sp. U2-2l TaxID=2884000 RepID=UPI001D09F2D5|nr:hypothetical protein [Rhodoferax sp. U2-2l]MCB8747858.1 hypothetical protein [Rhodoferax sp. U2-2l]